MELENLIENLCGIIGIMMMREGVTELEFPVEELRAMTMQNDGKALTFGTKGDTMCVRMLADAIH